jgi:hypothetical protein
MGLVFKENNLCRVLEGRKTQTRRTGKHELQVGKIYSIKHRFFEKATAKVLITRKFKQRLGDITLVDVKKEGFDTLEEFQAAWVRIYHGWNPKQIVTVYEFKLVGKERQLLSGLPLG